MDDDKTVFVDDETEFVDNYVVCFRYVGFGEHPRCIEIYDKAEFTIGRFDPSVGIQQSDFEFEKKTVAISRRHAVIKKTSSGYSLTDLGSTAGTFVADNKLTSNTSIKLINGCKVSFGNAGADYIWEEHV